MDKRLLSQVEALLSGVLAGGVAVAGTVRSGPASRAALGGNLTVLPVDMPDQAAVIVPVHRAFAALDRIDVIVKNAGFGAPDLAAGVILDAVKAKAKQQAMTDEMA